MTMPRKLLVDLNVTRYYHCISRCVRQASLCGKGFEHRKCWIEERLEVLSQSFAVSVCSFAIMDNHFHVLVRLDPDRVRDWTDEEVVKRWWLAFPPRNLDQNNAKLVAKRIKIEIQDAEKVAKYRDRLSSLGWFMKALKEPLARMANREDGCKGAFWEGRYKSIAILDEEALLATSTYIDLNAVAAGVADTPEASQFTSFRQRLMHAIASNVTEELSLAELGATIGSRLTGNYEETHWLCPLNDVRKDGGKREGMLSNFSFGSYCLLLDYTGRMYREGKATINSGLGHIFDRLKSSPKFWDARLSRLMNIERHHGCFFTVDRSRLRVLAARKGRRHLDNLLPDLVSA